VTLNALSILMAFVSVSAMTYIALNKNGTTFLPSRVGKSKWQ
jgi:hypothetical protein